MPRPLVTAALLPPLLIFVGMLGYMAIERWPPFDALYMAVITLTTIGFGEVHPLSDGGRAFTMGLALSGIFTMFFAASEVLRSWASGELQTLFGRRIQEQAMDRLENHLIVCGYGRMGRLVCREFSAAKVPYVVIDSSEASLAQFELEGGIALHGDATNDDCLRRAGIMRARALVTVVPADADNLFITMSARLLNEKLRIVARAEDDAASNKLLRAGATQVISPYVLGGARVAQAILRPNVHEFIDVTTRSGPSRLRSRAARCGQRPRRRAAGGEPARRHARRGRRGSESQGRTDALQPRSRHHWSRGYARHARRAPRARPRRAHGEELSAHPAVEPQPLRAWRSAR